MKRILVGQFSSNGVLGSKAPCSSLVCGPTVFNTWIPWTTPWGLLLQPTRIGNQVDRWRVLWARPGNGACSGPHSTSQSSASRPCLHLTICSRERTWVWELITASAFDTIRQNDNVTFCNTNQYKFIIWLGTRENWIVPGDSQTNELHLSHYYKIKIYGWIFVQIKIISRKFIYDYFRRTIASTKFLICVKHCAKSFIHIIQFIYLYYTTVKEKLLFIFLD